MRLRARLWIGLIALSLLTIVVSGVGIYALVRQSQASRAVLQENYRTLEYVTDMHDALNEYERVRMLPTDSVARQAVLQTFDRVLRQQEANITEPGERAATARIRLRFQQLQAETTLVSLREIRDQLDAIARLNQNALLAKNDRARRTADLQLNILAGTATLVLVFLFTFLYSFPGSLLRPVEAITRKITAIAQGQYQQEIDLPDHRHDEIGDLARAFNAMSAELVRYQQTNIDQLQFERSRLTQVLNTLNEALLVLDADKRVLVVNPAMQHLLNVQPDSLNGLYAPDVAATHDLLRTLIQPLMQPGGVHAGKPISIVVDRETRQYQPEAVMVHDLADGTGATPPILGYVLGLVDVTPFHAKDVAKTQFLATVSHELKTPLAGIGLSLRLLDDPRVGNLNDEQRNLVANILSETERLKKLTAELLDMTQLESGNIQLRLQPVDLREVAETTIAALQAQAEAKQLTITTGFPPTLPRAQADPDKLRWVLSNLLVNAIRYSPTGGTVHIAAASTVGTIQLSVADQGPGIPSEHRQRVFERYFRVPGQAGGGTGLGLAISREFVEAMGGSLALVDSFGGSRFEIALLFHPY